MQRSHARLYARSVSFAERRPFKVLIAGGDVAAQAKIVARYLTPYLESRDRAAVR